MKPGLEVEGDNYRISGNVTVQSLDNLSKTLLVHATNRKTMNLDLSRVSACDSAFIALLMACAQIKKQQNQTLSLSGCPKKVLDMLDVYGINGVLRLTN